MANRKPSGKARTAREPLTRERIVEAALQLIDETDLETLSMRRLGAKLGVEAMAIYHHFANKGELLDGVLERLVDEVELPPRGSVPPLDRIRRFARSHRQIALTHPHAFILIPTRRFNTERTIALYEQVLEAFADLGLNGELSARYFRTLGYFVSGAGLADIASHAQQPDATPVKLEAFDDPRFPLVSAVVPHLRTDRLDAVFEFGLELVLAAMERDAASIKQQRRKSANKVQR